MKNTEQDANSWLQIGAPFDLDQVPVLERAGKLLQTQLITGRHKPRAWYYDLDGDRSFKYVLKAPLTEEAIRQLVKTDIMKRRFGLIPTIKEVRSNALIFYNYAPIEPSCVEKKTSKLETDATVYVGDHFFVNIDRIDSAATLELLKILAFRKVVGTNDTCTRNIIHSGDKLYSIDDPFLNKTTANMFKTPLPGRQSYWYKDRLKKSQGVITYTLGEWRRLVTEMPPDEWITEEDKRFMLTRIAELEENEWAF